MILKGSFSFIRIISSFENSAFFCHLHMAVVFMWGNKRASFYLRGSPTWALNSGLFHEMGWKCRSLLLCWVALLCRTSSLRWKGANIWTQSLSAGLAVALHLSLSQKDEYQNLNDFVPHLFLSKIILSKYKLCFWGQWCWELGRVWKSLCIVVSHRC